MKAVYDMSTGQLIEADRPEEIRHAPSAREAEQSLPMPALQELTIESREEPACPPELAVADLNAFIDKQMS